MAALLKKIRNRGKHEETPASATAVEETVVSEETSTEPPVSMNGVLMQLCNLIQVVKGSPSPEESPNHRPVAVSGSLFSGMKLTKTARKQESESSPYLKRLELSKCMDWGLIQKIEFMMAMVIIDQQLLKY